VFTVFAMNSTSGRPTGTKTAPVLVLAETDCAPAGDASDSDSDSPNVSNAAAGREIKAFMGCSCEVG